MPALFCFRADPEPWLTNGFRRFCTAFCKLDEAFEGFAEGLKGFPLPPLLPITAATAEA
jgi:hypothetical protein